MDQSPMKGITSLDQAIPAWLTDALHTEGVLGRGEVVSVDRRANDAFNSQIAHLTVSYTPNAPASVPKHVLLKLNHEHAGVFEARLYTVAGQLRTELPMLARCYGAAYDASTGDSVCLLEDLSETHAAPITREQAMAGNGVPTDGQLDGIVDALAAFHAYWWEHPRLAQVVNADDERPWPLEDFAEVRPWFRNPTCHRRHVERRQKEWAAFQANVGDWVPVEITRLYQRVLARLPQLWDHYLERRVARLEKLTVTNGDCYFTQFLCPRDPTRCDTRIVDFQDASANLAAYDLVYLFATFWTPEQRHENRREDRLLRRYHRALQAAGIIDFTWDDLLTDYKLMITYMLFDPVWNQTSGASQAYWWPKLQCLVGAFQDLECEELLL
jgi:hypothetical protein